MSRLSRKLKHFAKSEKFRRILIPLEKKYYLLKSSSATPGDKAWLIGHELKYGGIQVNVERGKVSPKDPRSPEQIRTGGMTGGDRMLHHGYASKYASYLKPFITSKRTVTLAEFGILRGTGLAMWCDLFPDGRILGFDIDLGHAQNNMKNLKSLGAFRNNQPELHEYDQFEDNTEYLNGIIKRDKIDICIDDGFHSDESILTTMKSVMPYLADDAVYLIEDNKHVHKKIKSIYPDLVIDHKGELTVISMPEASKG